MGWKPSEYHGGIKGILETKRFPKAYCIRDSEYIEGLGEHVTGWKHKQKVLQRVEAQEAGDPIHGARNEEVHRAKGTLTFTMDSSPTGDKRSR